MQRMITSVVVSVLLGGFTVVAAQLPPEIMMDRHLLRAERLMAEEDHQAALDEMNQIVALQRAHSLTLPEEFHFKYAQVALSAGMLDAAVESANEYLIATGRSGEFYNAALALLDEVEQIQLAAEQIRTEACAGQPEGGACWMELDNQQECYVWNPDYQPYKTATWTAECSGGLAQGTGTLTWVWDIDQIEQAQKPQDGPPSPGETGTSPPSDPELRAGASGDSGWDFGDDSGRHANDGDCDDTRFGGDRGADALNNDSHHGRDATDCRNLLRAGRISYGMELTGRLQAGQRHGDWVIRYPDGRVEEGPYVEGLRHGRWVFRYASGSVVNRIYVNGRDVGLAEPDAMEGLMVSGKAHGRWVERFASGQVQEGPYVEGQKHGHWVDRREDGSVEEEGPYVKGQKHGHWVEIDYSGGEYVGNGSYVEGERHGDWVFRREDGDVKEGPYVDGERHGHWVDRGSFNDPADSNDWWHYEGDYVEGKRHGRWIIKRPYQRETEVNYVNGERQN